MTELKPLTEKIPFSSEKTSFKIPIKQEKNFSLEQNDSLSFTLAFLDKNYYHNIWKSTASHLNDKQKCVTVDSKSLLTAIIEILYGTQASLKLDSSAHLLNIKSYTVNNDSIAINYDQTGLNNLHDILMYSPRAIDSNEKILFIFYQLLKFVKYLHSINLNCGEIKLSDIYIDNNYWIRVKLPFESIINLYKVENQIEYSRLNENDDEIEGFDDSNEEIAIDYAIRDNLEDIYDSYKSLNFNDLANITKNWCNNKISNFNYLLILNCIAGRKFNCPYNHPIFPWISDFQSLNTNLRDLTVSKFRLNKGDPHLDLIYQESKSNPTGPYHLTEFLSEITYFVYKSRVTSKEILCTHVRRQWVPNEYPISISRLYLWTPEECIPEFFCDTSIFKSIHDDLPDLKVPDWCNGSVDEFVRTHRLLLDSDLVSKKLHHWIDLVFGFKLSGEAAVEAKNVCLPLIDNHQNMRPYGITQLFTVPHPNRAVDKIYHSEKPPKIKNKFRIKQDITDDSLISNPKSKPNLQLTQDADILRKKTGIKSDQFDNQILLPDDYNPLALIDQMESLLRFTAKAYHHLPEPTLKIKSYSKTFDDLAHRDLKCLVCLLAEILIFPRVKCLPQQNTLEIRYSYVCKAIIQEPHIISGPFMPIIFSILKPFGDIVTQTEKQSTINQLKRAKTSIQYYFEYLAKYQTEFVSVESLLNKHLSILPFKPYFEALYKFSEIFCRIEYLIKEFSSLKPSNVYNQLMNILHQTGSLNNQFISNKEIITQQQQRAQTSSKDYDEDNQSKNSRDDSRSTSSKTIQDNASQFKASNPSEPNESYQSNEDEISNLNLIKIDTLYEQKFYLGLLYIPSLMFDMSDPKKNQLAQSICYITDSFELIIPYLLNLFENPNTCVNSFLFLFNKLSRFMSQAELNKKFLPIIIQVLNVVDLSETIGIDLAKDEEKVKFCKLFDFSFINELRIIFGLQVFLTQICPFLIEAISGFKDFEYEADHRVDPVLNKVQIKPMSSLAKPDIASSMEEVALESGLKKSESQKKLFNNLNKMEKIEQTSDIFDMEETKHLNPFEVDDDIEQNIEKSSTGSKSLNNSRDADSALTESELLFKMPISPINKNSNKLAFSLNAQQEMSSQADLKNKMQDGSNNESFFKQFKFFSNSSVPNESNAKKFLDTNKPAQDTVFECDRVSLGVGSSSKQTNISNTAFNTFVKIVGSLGPVLSCKYCCSDLFKMLAICYMNSKCLGVIETFENPLNSIRPIEGDRFSYHILESLKTVASFYGEQVIVLQYLTHVSNTVAACVNRLTIKLEATLLAGVVLVYYFTSYLDIKQLMDNLTYIINQIVLPVISLYTNEQIKFPNGYAMRQVLAFKILDIILILSLRIGPEQTRIEMEKVLRKYFDGFSLVRSSIMNSSMLASKPVRIEELNKNERSTKYPYSTRDVFKARPSIVSFSNHRSSLGSKDNNLLLNNSAIVESNSSKDTISDLSSYDEYLKYSYDQSTNEITGSSLKNSSDVVKRHKYRSQSFGLLSLNNEENESIAGSVSPRQNNSISAAPISTTPNESKLISSETNEEMVNTFTIELAHTAYLGISRLNSGVYIDSVLNNADLIHRMCLLDDQANKKQANLAKNSANQTQKGMKRNDSSISGININKFDKQNNFPSSSYGSSFSENVGVIGNQIQIAEEEPELNQNISNLIDVSYEFPLNNNKFTLKFSEKELKDLKADIDTSRHLSDNWLAYWENEIRTNDKSNSFDFKHIYLMTLSGHSSAVKCIHALDNESSIISGSKDKTVKLWSLKNHSSNSKNKKNVQTCQFTYSNHKKPVFSILFIESLRVCATCDGSVHIWNPFVGRKLFQFDNQVVTCMSNLPSPSASFVVATSDNTVKFLDLRAKSFAYELKTCYAPSGSIKSICTADNLLLVGFSTGLMCLLDMRTGWIQESFKNLDNEILQLKFFSSDQFACTYNDGSISISSVKDKAVSQNMIKEYNEPVPYLTVTENQLITATNSNKIGIHSNIDKQSQVTFSLAKLKPDNFKGVISSQAYLPLNRLLLIGSDNGDIKLIC